FRPLRRIALVQSAITRSSQQGITDDSNALVLLAIRTILVFGDGPDINVDGKSISRTHELSTIFIEPKRAHEQMPIRFARRHLEFANANNLAVRQLDLQ